MRNQEKESLIELFRLENIGKVLYVVAMSVILVVLFVWTMETQVFRNAQEGPYNELQQQNEVQGRVVDLEQFNCVVQALFHEARGEPLEGILAVASVIHNRVNSSRYPNDHCSVIHQRMQFSYVHERQARGLSLQPQPKAVEQAVYQQIQDIAMQMLTQTFEPVLESDVLWYAHSRVNNYWTRVKQKVDQIGNHVFYKNPERINYAISK